MSRYPRPRINAKATLAETGSDVIKRQGGLSPSYGPSGINDTYNTGGIPAWNRLQKSMRMAQEGRATDADRIERADQLQGMGLQGGQELRNRVNFNTAALQPQPLGSVDDQSIFPTQAADNAQQNAEAYKNPEAFDPYSDETGYVSKETNVQAAAKGGNVTGKAVVGEAGPETKFNQDGSIDQFNKPTLLNNAKPGIIVPNPALKQFLKGYDHPPKDAVGIMPAFRQGGSLGARDIGSGLQYPQEVIGLSKRGQNSMGGITNAAGTVAAPLPMNPNTGAPMQPLKAADRFAPMAILPPSENSAALLPEDEQFNLDGTPKRKQMQFSLPSAMVSIGQPAPAYAQGGKVGQLPAYAEGGSYDMEETRTDQQGNVWARNPNKPDSGIIVKRAPVNQNMRRFLHSWEDPQNSGIVQNVDAYAQGLEAIGAGAGQEGFDQTVQAPAYRTPTTIMSRYGSGSVAQTPQTTVINQLPAEEFFQREANRGGANKFSTPEFDSSYASAQKKTGKKAPSLAQTNPTLFNEFEKWRKSIRG